jgi:thioredoxin 1
MLLISGIMLSAQTTDKPKTESPKPLVTFIELGSVNCIPCKMMQPVMKEVEAEYGDKIEVIFYDVWKPQHKAMSTKYKIRVIPTQVFLDKDGKEFFRHEGFYPKDEMVKMLDKQMGIKRKPVNKE